MSLTALTGLVYYPCGIWNKYKYCTFSVYILLFSMHRYRIVVLHFVESTGCIGLAISTRAD